MYHKIIVKSCDGKQFKKLGWSIADILPLKFTDGCENMISQILDDTVEIIQRMNSDGSQDVKCLLWKSLRSKQLNRQLNGSEPVWML